MRKKHTDELVDIIKQSNSLDALALVHKVMCAVRTHANATDDQQLQLAAHRLAHVAKRRMRGLRGAPYVDPAGVVYFPGKRAKGSGQ